VNDAARAQREPRPGKGRRLAVAVAIATLFLSFALTSVARAQAAGDREDERTALYRVGVAQADAGRWAEAVETFRKVIAIRSAPPALFTLGQAEEHLGHLAGAQRTYQKALADARAAGNQDVAAAARKAIAAVQPRVPHMVVHVGRVASGLSADGATATVDGETVTLGASSDVDLGDHDVLVRAPGAQPFARKVHVVEGQTLDVSAELEPEIVAPPPSSAAEGEASGRGSSFPLGPVILGGVGAVAGIAGVVVRISGQSDYNAASAICPGNKCTTQSTVDSGNSGRGRMIVGTAVLGVGVAAVAVAGLWWVLTPSSAPDAQVGFGIESRDGGLGASLAGRF
jgi:hypothetical protein